MYTPLPLWGAGVYKLIFDQNPKGVSMIRVIFGPMSKTVYIDILLNTIVEMYRLVK
jgi:hypothetical protein